MRRRETHERIDRIAGDERRGVLMATAFAVIAAFVIMMLGYYPGAYRGDVTATVRWSEMGRTWKSLEPNSRIRAVLASGAEIYATSPHTPPPVPGDAIVLEVRENILGWHSYTWLPGKMPALTDGPGKR